LGDGVNVAARLEGINKLFGTTICISDSIYDQVRTEILARPLKRVQLKGRKAEFMIYELLALRASDDPELRVRDRDEQLCQMTWQASQNFEAGHFVAAERAYRAILEVFPDDSLARFMIAECMKEKEPIFPMMNGDPRSDANTNADLGSCSRCNRRNARSSSPRSGWVLGEPFLTLRTARVA
jgi:hypothetical protein